MSNWVDMSRRLRTTLLAIVAVLALLPAAVPAAEEVAWAPYDRPAEFAVVSETDIPLTMRDGVVLRADVHRPDAPGRFPVILTQTPYSKGGAGLGGANTYFVERGYVHVVVDVRGTGGSGGQWNSFGEAEQGDGYELVEWAAAQEWSDGKVGLWGASYLAINQLFTAALQPPSLRAIFPIVPSADTYRDIVMAGGQVNTAFIPLWLGLVTSLGIQPPTYTLDDPVAAAGVMATHAGSVPGFQAQTVIDTTTGGDGSYDGPFHRLRSPIEVIDRVQVPAFVVGGLRDIFQRGEPLVYEALAAQRPHDTKLLMGDWTHGDFGSGLPTEELPVTLDQIALRWFDNYLKGTNTRIDTIPAVTQWVRGAEVFAPQADWPNPAMSPQRWYLRAEGLLSEDAPAELEPADTYRMVPVSGACTGSTTQWLIGLTEPSPCTEDNRVNNELEVVYTTPPLEEDLRIDGPIAARIWLRTDADDAVVVVRVQDVAPDGTSTELSTGLMAASHRRLNVERTRVVDGQMLMPYHDFTREAQMSVPAGEAIPVNVEIFPTSALLAEGHQLRISVGPSDVPHAMSPLPMLGDQLFGEVQIIHDGTHASWVNLPVVAE